MNPAYAKYFFKELLKIHNKEAYDWKTKCVFLDKLVVKAYVVATKKEQIQFTNLFSRISYAGQKFEIDKKTEFQLHTFRRLVRRKQEIPNYSEWEELYELGLKITPKIIQKIWDIAIPPEVYKITPKIVSLQIIPTQAVDFQAFVRVVLMKDDPDNSCFQAINESTGGSVIVRYNLPERNANFNPTIRAIRDTFGFPQMVNLIDVEFDEEGVLRPKAFVVEPDYLMDITAVAECFQPQHNEPMLYLLKKMMPFSSSSALIIGNIANFFLDELMTNPDAQFMELFPKVFGLFPLRFAMMSDGQVKEIMLKSKGHFQVIKMMVKTGFAKNEIDRERCYLEPTFYSAEYGLQGRLDAFHHSEKSAIVELKSGKAYMPNAYGLSNNHFTQTLLYDLLIKTTFNNKLKPTNYILYSSSIDKPLRFAPVVKSQQYEALQIRNQLVAIERGLALSALPPNLLKGEPQLPPDPLKGGTDKGKLEGSNDQLNAKNTNEESSPSKESKSAQKANPPFKGLGGNSPKGATQLLAKLRPQYFPKVKGFQARDMERFEKTYVGLTPLEKKYFNSFVGFIAREHRMAKTGMEGVSNANGIAALWRNTFADKQRNFEVISHLQIVDNQSDKEEPIIVFKKTEQTNPLANFRVGDIGALYPFSAPSDTVLNNQVFKITIIELNKEQVVVRLRSRQFNTSIFEEQKIWNLEHDLLDSSFVGMYRGLFEFASAPRDKKDLLLLQRPPSEPDPVSLELPKELTREQGKIFRKVIASKDYFLLWGPPGTGKTSMMLKNLAGHYFNETDENVLILAYTNRAVDEICAAIESLGEEVKNSYIRIGSRYGTDPRFRGKLLDQKIAPAKKRSELLDIVQQHRVFVATLSSFGSKMELLEMKKFKRVIIDEASQVLEPMLTGLLTHFEHFTLIGDHKQLPAVVTQSPELSATKDEKLESIGLSDMRNSFFERLFLQCEKNGWSWAYDRLSHQGRMHEDIMTFPNEYFYQGHLKILPEEIAYRETQQQTLDSQQVTDRKNIIEKLLTQRVLFLPSKVDMDDGFQKTNKFEAAQIVDLVGDFRKIFKQMNLKASIGVITPYRAQIALITDYLAKAKLLTDDLSIDTVERYQGSARDVILISLCTNTDSQLASMTSLMSDGTDRKLNVALTRARHHLVVVGCPEMLKGNPLYEKFMERYKK